MVLESPEPIGVGALAQASSLPKSTASRLVSSLERHGLVHRTSARGKLQAGPVVLRFAHRGAVDRNLVALAGESLAALSSVSGETANLAVPGPRGVEHLAQVDGAHFLATGQWVGRTVDYARTAAGKVFLAHRVAQLPGDVAERELAACRRAGFAKTVDELEPGLSALAAPVRGPTGDVVAALVVSGPTFRLPARRMAQLRPPLAEQAAALSERLGHRDIPDRAA